MTAYEPVSSYDATGLVLADVADVVRVAPGALCVGGPLDGRIFAKAGDDVMIGYDVHSVPVVRVAYEYTREIGRLEGGQLVRIFMPQEAEG